MAMYISSCLSIFGGVGGGLYYYFTDLRRSELETVFNVNVEFQVDLGFTDLKNVENKIYKSITNDFGEEIKNLTISYELDDADLNHYSFMVSFEYKSNERVNVTQSHLDQKISNIFVDLYFVDKNEMKVKVKCNQM